MVSESRAVSPPADFCLKYLSCAAVRVLLLRVFSHAGIRWRLYRTRRQRVCLLEVGAALMRSRMARRKFAV